MFLCLHVCLFAFKSDQTIYFFSHREMTKITTVIISPSCLRVVVLLMVMMIGPHNSASLEHKGVAMHKGAQGNLIFTENLLWSIVRPSVLSCAVTCVSDHNCVCFTVTKTASTGRHRTLHDWGFSKCSKCPANFLV